MHIQDEKSGASKMALIHSFCSTIAATGLIIDPNDINPEVCYELISNQCKSKAQLYTFMRLLFANPDVERGLKVRFLRGMQRLDEAGIKDLDDILDRQGGFTPEAAARHLKDFGGFNDQDVLLEGGCFACIPDWETKQDTFGKFLAQEGWSVKTLEVAGSYIYCGLTKD